MIMNFSETLKCLRKEHGMTQAQLAQKAGLSKGAIGNFESGKRTKISFESVCRLANALEVEMYRLFVPQKLAIQSESIAELKHAVVKTVNSVLTE